MATWMDKGIPGTAKVVEYKITLKGARQRSSIGMTSLSRKIGIFKELVNGQDEDDQKSSSFLNDELKSVLEAKKLVESHLR